jgi:SIR2-like protein
MPTNVTFLLGAGASVPSGIPHVRRFYEDFRDHLSRQFGGSHELALSLRGIEEAWEKERGTKLSDLERLYETLTFLNDTSAPRSIPLRLPDRFPPRSRAIELLEWELKKYVQQRCLSVRPRNLDYLRPISHFLRLSRPLAIISLNYDACLEIVMEEAGVSWTDGGPPGDAAFFASRLDFPESTDVHLIKLHGSATWYHTKLELEPGWMRRVRGLGQVGVSRKFGAARTLTHEAMMIYPTLNKALTNGPFPTLTLTAQKALAGSKLCLAVGYSFADVHVRRLVLEALSLNPELKLILVNPRPREILETLYRDAGFTLHDRIGIASARSREFGFVEKALDQDWLLRRSEEWLQGAPIVLPFASSRGKIGGPRTRLPSPSRWRLRYPIEGGVAGLARGEDVLYLVLRMRQEIRELDTKTGTLRTLATGFQNLRGLAFDPTDRVLYAVSNKYHSWFRRAPWRRGGIGQLWAIDASTGSKHSITRIHWLRTGIGLVQNRLRGGQEAFWKQLAGGLRWPTSVIVEVPGRSLLFTEAKTVRRIDLRTGALSTPIEIPLPFNVVGLSMEAPEALLIADAGVHPNGFGRLMRAMLREQRVELLEGGWRGIGSLAHLPSRRVALLSQVGPWPQGRAFSLDLDAPTNPPRFSWEGLNRPSQFSVNQDETEVLISTGDGIVDLHLR